MKRTFQTFNNQSGGAIYVFSIILVVIMSMIGVYSARITTTEHKISANHYRSKQAFESAQAGADIVLNHLTPNIISQINPSDVTTKFTDISTLGINLPVLSPLKNQQSPGAYSVSLKQYAINKDIITIKVEGFSGDTSVSSPGQIITQRLLKTSLISYRPPAPLIARDTINIGNGLSIINRTNNPDGNIPKATWSGGKTHSKYNNISATIDVVSQDGKLDGLSGIYEMDTALKKLTPDKLFQNFFTKTKSEMKAIATVIDCHKGCTGGDINNMKNRIIWIDATKSNNSYETLRINRSITIGSENNPVILIIDGNLKLDDINANISGIIYTTQDFENINGAGNINGSLISEGKIIASGNFTFTYKNKILLSLINNMGSYVRIAGSWKDF